MTDKQFFAQVGIFLLLCLNVTAYFIFWPSNDESAARTVVAPAATKNLQNGSAEEQEHGSPGENASTPPSLPASPPPSSPEWVASWPMNDGSIPPPLAIPRTEPLPSIPQIPLPLSAPEGITPRLQVTSLMPYGFPNGGVVMILQVEPAQLCPWLLSTEEAGARTTFTAKLKQPTSSGTYTTLKVICDRLDMKSPDGAVRAVGKVAFSGAGLKGTCQRLTLLLGEPRIIFEENVEIAHGTHDEAPSRTQETIPPASVLRSEKLIWDVPAAPRDAEASKMRPVRFEFPPATLEPPVTLQGPK